MKIEEKLQEIKNQYPELTNAEISYKGSGDSFEDFYTMKFYSNGILLEYDNEIWNNTSFEELCWHAIENSNADFNDDGSRGIITFDFENLTMRIVNN